MLCWAGDSKPMSYAAEPLKIAYLITYINRHNKSVGRQATENESRHRTAHGGPVCFCGSPSCKL